MSKSYGNAINLFDSPKEVKKRIMSIQTDSTPVEAPKDPDSCNVFAIYRLLATPNQVKELEAAYRAGGMGYGEAKKRLVEAFESRLGPLRERRAELAAKPAAVEDILADGAARARRVAQGVMERVRNACGLVTVQKAMER
jgi:tryptophanyl-tRNA synthetase